MAEVIFHDVAERILDDLLRLHPEEATDLGEHAYDHQLDDLTEPGLSARRTALTRGRDELDSVDLAALSPADAVDADMLRNSLDSRLFQLDVVQRHTWDPLVWLPGDALYPLIVRDTVPLRTRLESLARRLGAVPDRLATARATLTAMPAVHAETAAVQAEGTLALVHGEVDRLLDQSPGSMDLRTVQQDAARALTEFAGWLRAQPADGDPRLGEERFAAALHLTLASELSAQQVVSRAQDNLERVTGELAALARDWTGSRDGDEAAIREALDRVAATTPDDTSIVGLAQQAMADTTDVVRRLGLLEGIRDLPDDACEIEVMPEFRRGVAVAYCDAPGPLESGGVTRFAISPTPAGWSPERVRSFYREYNTAMIINLTVHEAMPGHVVQLALGRRHRGATRVRQVLGSGSFREGWAVHAERIVADTGAFGVPVKLQQLKMQLRMTLNALLDAGVHAGGMTEAEGLDLLRRRGFQEEGEAVGKWRRALLSSTQLSTYFVGWAELAPVLEGRTTYDEVLAHGSPSPRHLPTLLTAP